MHLGCALTRIHCFCACGRTCVGVRCWIALRSESQAGSRGRKCREKPKEMGRNKFGVFVRDLEYKMRDIKGYLRRCVRFTGDDYMPTSEIRYYYVSDHPSTPSFPLVVTLILSLSEPSVSAHGWTVSFKSDKRCTSSFGASHHQRDILRAAGGQEQPWKWLHEALQSCPW